MTLMACSQPAGYVPTNLDCDDTDSAVSGTGIEVCNGVDDDCDGLVDDLDPSLDPFTLTIWYADSDGDGVGDLLNAVAACAPPAGYVADPTDCDDADPYAGAPSLWFEDLDGDGAGAGAVAGPTCVSPGPTWVRETAGLDCDDADPGRFPGAPEVFCDGIDQDCNGSDQCEILWEDFETGTFEPTRWASTQGDLDISATEVASGAFAAVLSGGGSEARTVPLNSSNCNGVFWSYMGKRGPEAPDTGDFFTIEWFDGFSWMPLDTWEGAGTNDPSFSYRSGTIVDPLVNRTDLELRFSSAGSGTGFDDFFIDDFLMECL